MSTGSAGVVIAGGAWIPGTFGTAAVVGLASAGLDSAGLDWGGATVGAGAAGAIGGAPGASGTRGCDDDTGLALGVTPTAVR
jgi:hypothetical protein